MQLSYNLPSPFFPLGTIAFSFRVYTDHSVYYPEKHSISLTRDTNAIRITKSSLVGPEGNTRREGALFGEITRSAGEYSLSVRAEHERAIRAISLVIANAEGTLITHPASLRETPYMLAPYGEIALTYPELFVPVAFLHSERDEKNAYYFRFKDTLQTGKRIVFRKDEVGATLIEMVYEIPRAMNDNATARSCAFTVGVTRNIDNVLTATASFLEHRGGVKEYSVSPHIPKWAKTISLLARIHCLHATGHRFHDFTTAQTTLTMLARRADKHSALAILSGWDGPYMTSAQPLLPSAAIGGETELRALIETAHMKGIRVALELSARYASIAALTALSLSDAIEAPSFSFDGAGSGFANTARARILLSHEGYRAHVEKRLRYLLSLGVDGFFFTETAPVLGSDNAAYYAAFIALLSSLRADYPDCAFAADSVIDATAPYLALVTAGETDGAVFSSSATLTRRYPLFMKRFTRFAYSQKTPNEQGLVGVEPEGIVKPIYRDAKNRIALTLNILSPSIETSLYALKTIDTANKLHTLLL